MTPKSFRFRLLAGLAVWLAACIGAAGAAAPEMRADIVGEVVTAIGESRIAALDGEARLAARGERIRTGDRIETAIGGHVHIRFVDGGLVSVRPLSRLHIEAYRNGDGRSLAAIKFRLEEGVMRSVTGQWGEAHRERFRLNTPVAAIGIKGTDFVVRTGRADTLASVSTGAIVMAPLEGVCADTLGPCSGDNAALLTADMPGMMLEIQRQNGVAAPRPPRLVPAVDLLARAAPAVMPETARGAGSETAGIVEKVAVGDSGAANQLAENIETLPTVPSQLRWLHNAAGWNVPANTISERYEAALAAGHQAVAGNLFITLYRDATRLPDYPPDGAAAAFLLREASATYARPGLPAENVAVSGATLDVDFTRATFATRLALASPSLGQTEFAATGAIDRNGVFVARQTGQSIAGAFSMDGREAGYLFDKTVPGGSVGGLTLWGR